MFWAHGLKVPTQASTDIGVEEGASIPVVVMRDINESRMSALTDDDRMLVEKNIEVIDVRGSDDVVAVLTGKGFGEELWKILAIAAFFFLLFEVALARWISRSRHAAEDGSLDFEHLGDPDASFLSAFKRMKESTK